MPTQTFTTYIEATPDAVWTTLTDAVWTRRYFDLIEGFLDVASTWTAGDPITYRVGAEQVVLRGTVLVADAPRSFEVEVTALYDPILADAPPARWRCDITPFDGACRLRFTHEEATESAFFSDVAACLPSILANLRLLLETGRTRLIKELVVDCASPSTLAAFWTAALGWVRQAHNDDFAAIADPTGTEPEIAFQRVPEPKIVKNRMHFDLRMHDRHAQVARLVGLGGRVLREFDTWTVMADPEGNEFCVTNDG